VTIGQEMIELRPISEWTQTFMGKVAQFIAQFFPPVPARLYARRSFPFNRIDLNENGIL
jgi:hypothetical protein